MIPLIAGRGQLAPRPVVRVMQVNKTFRVLLAREEKDTIAIPIIPGIVPGRGNTALA